MLEDLQKYCNQFGLIEKGKYYDTDQIAQFFKNSREKNMESFLTRVFSEDMLQDGKR